VWLARELLSEVYAAPELATVKRQLIVFFQHAADADVPELTRFARTIDRVSARARCSPATRLAVG
jgi:hypothetical protein